MKLTEKINKILEAKVDWLMLVSSEENDRPRELKLNITDISKNKGGKVVVSFKPNKVRDEWENAMDENSNWTCSGRIKTPTKGVVIFVGRFMANMDKIVLDDPEGDVKVTMKDLGL